jgi:hypothetical protein
LLRNGISQTYSISWGLLTNTDFKDQYSWRVELGKDDCDQKCRNREFVNNMLRLTSKINNWAIWTITQEGKQILLGRQCTVEEQGT